MRHALHVRVRCNFHRPNSLAVRLNRKPNTKSAIAPPPSRTHRRTNKRSRMGRGQCALAGKSGRAPKEAALAVINNPEASSFKLKARYNLLYLLAGGTLPKSYFKPPLQRFWHKVLRTSRAEGFGVGAASAPRQVASCCGRALFCPFF